MEVSSVITSDPIYPTQSVLAAPSSPSRPASFCPPETLVRVRTCPFAPLLIWDSGGPVRILDYKQVCSGSTSLEQRKVAKMYI